jgi:hypothetical protein
MRCEKEDEIMSKKYPEYCRTCRQRISEKKYKETEKGKAANKKANQKRQANGYFVEKYRTDEKYRIGSYNRNKKRLQVSPEKVKAELKRHAIKHRDKYLARQWLRRAVTRGKIIKPDVCERCNIKAERIEGHHNDYSKRLEVEWLCVNCHKLEHGKI